LFDPARNYIVDILFPLGVPIIDDVAEETKKNQ